MAVVVVAGVVVGLGATGVVVCKGAPASVASKARRPRSPAPQVDMTHVLAVVVAMVGASVAGLAVVVGASVAGLAVAGASVTDCGTVAGVGVPQSFKLTHAVQEDGCAGQWSALLVQPRIEGPLTHMYGIVVGHRAGSLQ